MLSAEKGFRIRGTWHLATRKQSPLRVRIQLPENQTVEAVGLRDTNELREFGVLGL